MQKTEFCRIYEEVTGHNPDDSPLSADLLADEPLKFYAQITALCGNDPTSIADIFDILTLIKQLRKPETIDKAARRRYSQEKYSEKLKTGRLLSRVMQETILSGNSFVDEMKKIDRCAKTLSKLLSLPTDKARETAQELFNNEKLNVNLTPLLEAALSEKPTDNLETKENHYFNRAISEIYQTAVKTNTGQRVNWIFTTIAKVLDSLHIVKSNGKTFDRREIRGIVENTQ